MRYLVVTGGVMSGLGKGITAASAGRLLINRGHRVTAIKIDPYINIDAGTMNPFQHGDRSFQLHLQARHTRRQARYTRRNCGEHYRHGDKN